MKTLILIAFTLVPFLASASGEEPPKFNSFKTLKLYFTEGNGFVLKEGELSEKTHDTTLSSKGEIVFSITGENKALMIGTTGSTDVAFKRSASSCLFIEETPTGNIHVLTVFNTWNVKLGGFACVYNRCVDTGGLGGKTQIIATYYGVAKPFD